MASKKVWMTWMPAQNTSHRPEPYVRLLGQYGLETAGNTWIDNLEQLAWLEVGATLLDAANADLWLIASDQNSLTTPSNRYALSLLTTTVRDGRGARFPIVCLGLDGTPVAATMPTLMRSCQFITATEQSWPAKVVATAFNPPQVEQYDMRFGVYPNPLFGQWFEVGPREQTWTGVMFGVAAGGSITHHAVGRKGELPERTVLEYQIQGMQAQVGETMFTAWSVQNRLGPEDSYYVKVEGFPAQIIVGGHPGTDQAEVTVLDLQ